MSNLSNLYISQSYYGVVNLVDSTQPFASQSQTQIQFQDGVGESLGMSVTDVKDFIFDNNVVVSQSIEVLGVISGSDARFNGDLFVSGNVHATQVITTIESSSIIYSSGSNIIGDEVSDVQTIVGQTSISGSLTVIGPHSHTGDVSITGSLFVSNEISSSTISGLGNATIYSQSVDNSINTLSQSVDNTIQTLSSSVDSRLDFLEGPFSTSVDSRLDFIEGPFSTSVDQRLDSLELFTASLSANFVTDVEYSASIAVVTGSLITQINTKLNSGSFNTWTGSVFTPFSSSVDTRINTKLENSWTSSVFTPFSSSVDSRINTNASNLTSVSSSFVTTITNLSSSIAVTDTNQQSQINSLIDQTGSYATLGSNTFSGSQIITGSVLGNVNSLSVVSSTASIDCSQGNFFTITLPTGSTYLTATNITPGQTISLKLATTTGRSVQIDSGSIKFPSGLEYSPSQVTSEDLVTFVSFPGNKLYAVAVNLYQ